ncbi:MAG: PEP-CTERM sorting domain-containing protein [Chloroflexota bacterium]
MLRKISSLFAGVVFVVAAASAQAAIFTQGHGFGEFGSSFSECYSASTTSAFATGLAFDASPGAGAGCVGYFDVLIDTTAKTITLRGDEHGNYEGGYLEITGITEEVITSLTTVTSNGLFDPNFYPIGSGTDGLPAPQLSFTGDSIRIQFSTFGGSPSQFTYDGDGGTAVFSYNSSSVPEPGGLLLFATAMGLVALRKRRFRADS